MTTNKSIFVDKNGLEQMTGLSYSFIAKRWIRKGTFPKPVAFPGSNPMSKRFWRRSDVEEWAAGIATES